MELSEQIVKVNFSARVHDESLPVATSGSVVLSLKLVDDFGEIPGKSQHVGVLLLVKLRVDTKSCILRLDRLDLAGRGVFHD